jgi:hypothetical protein
MVSDGILTQPENPKTRKAVQVLQFADISHVVLSQVEFRQLWAESKVSESGDLVHRQGQHL